MKHISIIASIILLSTVNLTAQDTFILKKHGIHTYNKPKDLCIKPNGNIIFLFLSEPTGSSDIFTNYVFEINGNGDVLDSVSYADTTKKWFEFNHCYYSEDTLYLFGSGCNFGSPQETFLRMLKLDTHLNIIDSFTFNPGLENFVGTSNGELKFINNQFYYISAAGNQSTSAPFCAIISKQGQLVNFGIELNFPNAIIQPFDFVNQDVDEGYTIFNGSPGFQGVPAFSGIVSYFNKSFQLEDYFALPNNMFLHFTYQALNDSVYFLAGEWVNLYSNSLKRAGILKLMNDTILVDEFLYNAPGDSTACPAYRHSLEILPDDNLIFCFTDNIDIEVLPQIYPAKINLMKLTPEMDIIWHRYIGDEKAKWDAFEMHVNEAEEIIIHAAYNIADISQLLNRDVLFIKTTPDGLITGINDELTGFPSTETLLYPNPAQDFAIVEFSMAYQAATLVINKISGQEVFKTRLSANKQQVDISSVPAGNYVYRIFNRKGLDESGKLVVGK